MFLLHTETNDQKEACIINSVEKRNEYLATPILQRVVDSCHFYTNREGAESVDTAAVYIR